MRMGFDNWTAKIETKDQTEELLVPESANDMFVREAKGMASRLKSVGTFIWESLRKGIS